MWSTTAVLIVIIWLKHVSFYYISSGDLQLTFGDNSTGFGLLSIQHHGENKYDFLASKEPLQFWAAEFRDVQGLGYVIKHNLTVLN
jgi:hypothetical protein